jgi:DME family drug/metabolite transporter
MRTAQLLCNNDPMLTARVHILLAAVLFGTTGTAQALVDGGSPLAVGSARIAVGGAALAALALACGALRGLRPAAPALLLASLGVAVYQLSFFAAVEATGVAVGTVVAIGSAPVVTGLLEWRLEGLRPGRRWVVATALAAGGVVALGAAAGGDQAVDPLGVALALAAGGGYASYAVVARRLLRRGHAPVGVMAGSFGGGALLLLPVLMLDDGAAVASGSAVVLALYLGLIPTALAYVLYARGLQVVSAAEATTVGLAEPLTASVLGAAVLGERLGPGAGLGALLVLAALFALAAPPVRRRPRSAAACSAA